MNKYTNNFKMNLTDARKAGVEFYYPGYYCSNGSNSMKRVADKACMCLTCEVERGDKIKTVKGFKEV